MERINWANYNFDEFTLFCNALLTFEFGKSFKGFSAPGKDGGIDGQFTGNYLGQQGSWRFQYKFRQGARIEGVRNLKSKVKSELQSLKDESFFVLITNLELLPQEFEDILSTFKTEITVLGKNCQCWIWDGTKLFDLYLQYPLLQLWLTDGFHSAQLQLYEDAFRANLSMSDFSPGTLKNLFVSRADDLKGLNDFLQNDSSISLITGEAGIGKTRLVVEFFKSVIDTTDDWIALVLINRNVDFDKIKKSLSGSKNYIILIDDAHTYRPEIISDMKSLCDIATNKIKLILTARNLEAFDSLTLMREYEKASVHHFKVHELTRSDTESIFKHYIINSPIAQFTNQLIEISYGKPILIVAILAAIESGVSISKIREDGFLKSYVAKYFDSYYTKVVTNTGWSLLKAKQILQHIALIEPFNYDDSSVINRMCEIYDVKGDELSLALKILVENGFVDGRYIQSIKPDYYSDIILSTINRASVSNFIARFADLLSNIIINLSSVDEVAKDPTNLLDEILNIYCESVNTATSIEHVKRVLYTINSITLFKKEIAKKVIDIYLSALSNSTHVIYDEAKELRNYPHLSSQSTQASTIEILNLLLTFPEFYNFVFQSAMKLYLLTNEAKVINVFSFGKRDAAEKFTLKRQCYVINQFGKNIKNCDVQGVTFCLSVIKSFLNLEYVVAESGSARRGSINLTTYYLPASNNVKKMRQSAVEFLINLYLNSTILERKNEIVKTILDTVRGILATKRNNRPYENNEEINIVLSFIKNNAETFNIAEKKEIIDKLFWFKKWGLSEEFHHIIEEINQQLQPKNLTEHLLLLFSAAELKLEDHKNIDKYIADKCDEIIEKNNKEVIAYSVIELLDSQDTPPHFFYSFLNTLVRKHHEYAKELYLQMYNSSPKLFNQFASTILAGSHFYSLDDNFYWEQVKVLQSLDSVDADNVLLSVYGSRVPGTTIISEKDVEIIMKIFEKNRRENDFSLSGGIQSLIVSDYPESYSICSEFLSRVQQRVAEMFFIWLSDNKSASDELISNLVLNCTKRFYISYEIERCLNRAIGYAGLDSILKYFTDRFEHKKQIVITQRTLMGYDFVPTGDHSQLFEGYNSDLKIDMYKRALNWYLQLDSSGGHLYYAKNLLEYLCPSKSISQPIADLYSQTIADKVEDINGLERIVETLSVFEFKDANLLDLIIQVYEIGYENKEINPTLFQKIAQECYSSITSMGVKSGTSGEPFQEDLDLRNLLLQKASQLPDYSPIYMFIKDVLKSVDADIDRSIDRENYKW